MQLNGTSEAAKPAPVKLPASERNELAIQVLHQSGVTPEHIETRTLYNDDCPGIPQVLQLEFKKGIWNGTLILLSAEYGTTLSCTALLAQRRPIHYQCGNTCFNFYFRQIDGL